MAKFKLTRAGGPWDYPTLGFIAVDGAVLDGAASTPPIATPPDAFWAPYAGGDAEAGITRYSSPVINPPTEPSDGFVLTYRDVANQYEPTDPADFVALPAVSAAVGTAAGTAAGGVLDAELDDRNAALVLDPGTATGAALTATIAAVAPAVSEGLLGNIAKAKTETFTLAVMGPSTSTFAHSPVQVLIETLKAIYGDSGSASFGGTLGGDDRGPYRGSKKQRHSGFYYTRTSLSADWSTGAVDGIVPGPTIRVITAREQDSTPADIYIDGVLVGQTTGPGPQKLRIAQDFTVSEGPHYVAIVPPVGAGSRTHFVRCDGLTGKPGIFVLDGSWGGTTLGAMAVAPSAPAEGPYAPPVMEPTIPTVGDAGIEAWMEEEFDALFNGHLVNDAGAPGQATYFENVFKPTYDKIVAATAAKRVPLLHMIDMPGHYKTAANANNRAQYLKMRAYLLALKVHPHVTVVDHDLATQIADDNAYLNRYYKTTAPADLIHPINDNTHPGPRIGTELLHTALGLTPPPVSTNAELRNQSRRRLASGEGRDVKAVIAGTAKVYPAAAGVAIQATTPSVFARVPYLRDPSPVNLAASWAASLAAPTGSDRWGSYRDMANVTQTLPASVDWAGGATRLLVVRGSGSLSIRASSNAQLLDPAGRVIPRTDVTNGRTQVRITSPAVGEEPVVLCVRVGASASGNLLDLSGRVYEAYMIDSDVPVLLKDATSGGTGAAGPAGPAGGFGAPLVSGRWVSASVMGTLTSTTGTLGRAYAVPMVVKNAGSLNGLGIDVATAVAGSTVRLGLYANDAANGRPGALLGDAGTVDASTTGFKSANLTTPVAVAAGDIVWLCYCLQGTAAATLRTVNGWNPMLSFDDTSISGGSTYRYTHDTSAALLTAWPASWQIDGNAAPARARVA